MFGYEIADILLFDLETLKESFSGYLSDYKIIFYAGLVINLILVYAINKSLRVVYALLAVCWIFPGLFFFIREFEPIFWPSAYLGYWAIGMGALQIYSAFNSRAISPVSQSIQLTKIQYVVTGVTLLPILITYYLSPGSVMVLGTSATVAALATLSLYVFQKGWFARIISLLCVLWCLIVALVLWALVYRV